MLSALLVTLTAASSQAADLRTVDYVDPTKYVGTWYQIARNPLFFEAGCVCSVQKLSVAPTGELNVFNSCNSNTPDGELRTISGTATSEDRATNAKYKVDFGLPQKGDYWIIGLDTQYRYAVVSDPSRLSLYILSKTPELDPALYNEAITKAAEQLETSKLVKTLQAGCTYPN